MSEVSKNQQAREWLGTQGGAATMAQVRAGLGWDRKAASSVLNDLWRMGFVTKAGPIRAQVYTLTGKVAKVYEQGPRTLEQKRASSRIRSAKNRRKRGALTWAEYAAQSSARHQAAREAKAAAKAEAQRQKQVAREAAAAEKEARRQAAKSDFRKRLHQCIQQKASKSRPAKQQPSVYRSSPAAVVHEERAETVAEWMARTGAQPERVLAHWERA